MTNLGNNVYKMTYEGHDYLIVYGDGKAIIHSASCKCWFSPNQPDSKVQLPEKPPEIGTL